MKENVFLVKINTVNKIPKEMNVLIFKNRLYHTISFLVKV